MATAVLFIHVLARYRAHDCFTILDDNKQVSSLLILLLVLFCLILNALTCIMVCGVVCSPHGATSNYFISCG